jgi:hypothetical protein
VGRGSLSRLCIHLGMLCAALTFASWWTSHTILDTARTRRVVDTVLASKDVRQLVANQVATVTAPALGTPALHAEYVTRLETVLGRSDIQAKLEQFVVDAHERLLGQRTQPAALDQPTVRTLVATAFPTMSAADLAKVKSVTFNVPEAQALVKSRETLAHRFWLYLLGAVVLLTIGLVTTDDRHASVKLIGKWLIGITLAHLVVLWMPVLILPAVTSNPWAHFVASVARAIGAGIISGLVVLGLVGVVFLFVDHFVPRRESTAPDQHAGAL